MDTVPIVDLGDVKPTLHGGLSKPKGGGRGDRR